MNELIVVHIFSFSGKSLGSVKLYTSKESEYDSTKKIKYLLKPARQPVKDIVETFLKVLNNEITIDDYVKIEEKYKIQLDTVDDSSNDFLSERFG